MKLYPLILPLIFLLFSACKERSIQSESQLYKWLNNEENGLSVTKVINGYKLNVKYLAPEYLAFLDMKDKENYSQTEMDSLINMRKTSRTFLFTIAPEHENKAERDIMYDQVNNYQEYKERAHTMNFQMGSFIEIQAGQSSFSPVLSTMENIYSLGNQRSLYLVFQDQQNKELLEAEELDLAYQDELFNTGITHFIFKKSDLDNFPSINIRSN